MFPTLSTGVKLLSECEDRGESKAHIHSTWFFLLTSMFGLSGVQQGCSNVCWHWKSGYAPLEGLLSHYSEMIYLNSAAGLFLHSILWKPFVSLWIWQMWTLVLVMGSEACRLFVPTVKELWSQTEGCFSTSQLAGCAQASTCKCIWVSSLNKLAPVHHLLVSDGM